jgi:hypothetical protein
MAKFTVSKADAARRQLISAIRLYFDGGDEVAIHTLAAAARNVLIDLCEHKGVRHPLLLEQMLKDLVKEEHHKEVLTKFREAENFFKHADRDPAAEMEFNSDRTDYILLEAVEAYTALTGERVPELHAYRGWYVMHHQDCLAQASEEFLKKLNGVKYAEDQRTQYFADMLAALARQN